MIKIYASMQNADLNEGRGPMVSRGYFTDKLDAEVFARTLQGVQGFGHGEVKEFEVFESLSENPKWTKAQAIDAAKAKLSNDELKVLGLSR